jgi:hypothetical protein
MSEVFGNLTEKLTEKSNASNESLSHTDLRIVLENYEVPQSENPLDHHDLRIVSESTVPAQP